MIQLGDRKIGDGEPCFITFEAGATHDGVESAKELTRMAAESGADAIKFQIFDPCRLVGDRKMPFSYDVLVNRKTGRTETVTEPLYDILCRRQLSKNEWKEVKQLSDHVGITFFSTVSFEEDINLINELGCHSIKIASGDINHWPLIRKAARTDKCIQIDTGNATLGEIESAVNVIRSEGNENIIIHHCPSGYPARLESINLKMISTLKQMFPYPVAFSDHTPGWDMDIAAIALGANLVEKTITRDRTTRSVEHIFSLEPSDMKRFIRAVRELEVALGMPRKVVDQEGRERGKIIRRSVFLREAVVKGQPVEDAEVEFRRPGYGIGPDDYEALQGVCFTRDLPPGHMLSLADIG